MTATELYQLILRKMKELRPDVQMPRIYQAILMENCEHAVRADDGKNYTEDELIGLTMHFFELARPAFLGLLAGAAKMGDIINITYRGETYRFDKNSAIIINALKEVDSTRPPSTT